LPDQASEKGNHLTVQNLSAWHRRDCRALFENLTFSINPGDKLAVIGEEGNGKSTLLKLLYNPDLAEPYADWEGLVSHKKETVGYFPQEEPFSDRTVGELTASLEPELYAAAMRKARQMGLGSEALEPARRLSSLSGGERVKLRLAILSADEPDILLLDEPTNDLDLDTLMFLENFLVAYPKAVVFISHDPDLLMSAANAILHLELTHRKTRCRATFERTDYLSYVTSRGLVIENQTRIARKERADLKAKKERWEEIYRKVDAAQASVSRQDPGTGRL